MPAPPADGAAEAHLPEKDRARTRELILERTRLDFEDGLRRIHDHVRAGHSVPVAATLNALVKGALKALRLEREIEKDAAFLLDLAEEVAAGADAMALAEAHIDRVVKLSHLQLIVKVKDPRFQEPLGRAREVLAKRLPDLTGMVAVEEPEDYDDLVRRAFPDDAYARAMIDEQADFARWVVAFFESHPDLLRVPKGMVPRLAATSREQIDAQVRKVNRSLDRIYGRDTAVGGNG